MGKYLTLGAQVLTGARYLKRVVLGDMETRGEVQEVYIRRGVPDQASGQRLDFVKYQNVPAPKPLRTDLSKDLAQEWRWRLTPGHVFQETPDTESRKSDRTALETANRPPGVNRRVHPVTPRSSRWTPDTSSTTTLASMMKESAPKYTWRTKDATQEKESIATGFWSGAPDDSEERRRNDPQGQS